MEPATPFVGWAEGRRAAGYFFKRLLQILNGNRIEIAHQVAEHVARFAHEPCFAHGLRGPWKRLAHTLERGRVGAFARRPMKRRLQYRGYL